MIDKAKSLPADEILLDVEDAVAPAAEAQARSRVAAAIAAPAEQLTVNSQRKPSG